MSCYSTSSYEIVNDHENTITSDMPGIHFDYKPLSTMYAGIPRANPEVERLKHELKVIRAEHQTYLTEFLKTTEENKALIKKNKELEKIISDKEIPAPLNYSAATYNNAIDVMKNDKYATWVNNELSTKKKFSQRELAEGKCEKYNNNIMYYVPVTKSDLDVKKEFVDALTKSAICHVIITNNRSKMIELPKFRKALKSVGIIMSDSKLIHMISEVSGSDNVKIETAVVIC